MTWRLAKSLDKLREQINAAAPNRSKRSDGTIGDEAHSARKSDHNVNAAGVVCALDITHDPAHGVDAGKIADVLRRSADPRINYIISNGRIANSGAAWRKYTGANAHTLHFHVSVKQTAKLYDDTSPWSLSDAAIKTPIITKIKDVVLGPNASEPVEPILKKGDKGAWVKELQKQLKIEVDGDFGTKTLAAVKAFQKKSKLPDDGVVGPYTWDALDAVNKPVTPVEPVKRYVYIMYGLGGRLFSSGMEDVLASNIRRLPNIVCPPTRQYYQWESIVDEIKAQPKNSRSIVIGHSMGAASATYVSDRVPVDLLVLYDLAGTAPSKIGKNTGRCIDIYDVIPDMVPEWRVEAIKGYENRIERWTSNHGHTGQDDSLPLMGKVVIEVDKIK